MINNPKICGDCNLCCKVVAVDSLAKPAGKWCTHAKPGRGCSIYGSRPDDCKGFVCGWLEMGELDEEWKPNKCKFVLRPELDGKRLIVDVDPGYPTAWQQPQYYNAIKQFSRSAWDHTGHVLVYVGSKATAIFPEEDLEIGHFKAGSILMSGYRLTNQWRQPFFRITASDGSVSEGAGSKFTNTNPVVYPNDQVGL